MDWLDAGFLLGAGMLAGGMNAVAGGGSFFSFPALLAVGVPPVSANATNSVGLWPAYIASAMGYRRELQRHKGLWLISGLSLVGGVIGGGLLLRTNDAAFARLVPFLLLFATVLFASSGWINRTMQRRSAAGVPVRHRAIVSLILFLIAIYGGFFGAGVGIMLLAVLGLIRYYCWRNRAKHSMLQLRAVTETDGVDKILHQDAIESVPAEIVRVAQAAFSNGHHSRKIADEEVRS